MMDALALGHNFSVYEDFLNQQGSVKAQQEQLTGEAKFAQTMKKAGQFGFFMSTAGGAVFLFRLLPVLSFGTFFIRALTIGFLLKEAIFCENDADRADYQNMLGAVGLGCIGAEWDAILPLFTVVGDFFTLYGVSLLAALIIGAVALILLLRSNQNQAMSLSGVGFGGGGWDND